MRMRWIDVGIEMEKLSWSLLKVSFVNLTKKESNEGHSLSKHRCKAGVGRKSEEN